MMKEPITNACFVNIARLWVINAESFIWTVMVGLIHEFTMESKYIISQMHRKLRDIFTASFSMEEFSPRDE